MNASQLDRRLDIWFDAVDPRTAPPAFLDEVLTVTRRTRQRRGVVGQIATLVAERRLPGAMEATPAFRLLLLTLLLVVALVAVAAAAGAIRFLPRPVLDGAIVVELPLGVPPDGTGVSHRLAMMMPDGAVVPLHAEPRREVCGSFSPDGSQLAYYTAPLDASQPSSLDDFGEFDYRLAIGSAVPNGAWRLLAPELTPDMRLPHAPAWSPHGGALAMVAVSVTGTGEDTQLIHHLVVVPTDGSPPTALLSTNPTGAADSIRWITTPTWSPDGNWIAFRGLAFDLVAPGTLENHRYVVAVVRPDGSDLRVLAEWALEASIMIETLAWSPDSRSVAYNRHAPGTAQSEHDWDVFVVSVDGAIERRLADTEGSERVVEWSPDGGSVAASVGANLRILDIASGAVAETRFPADIRGATWSAAGDRLAVFTGSFGGEGSIWALDRQEGATRLLAQSASVLCGVAGAGSAWQEVRP
jgi:Tol biopolymer transport system component